MKAFLIILVLALYTGYVLAMRWANPATPQARLFGYIFTGILGIVAIGYILKRKNW
jgi:membrane protein DedA with SNARE-associated domain